ncbi:Peptidyl-prolyl cis-trans isomerase cyp10 [Pestalotiopsis sp. IQ-011]
MIIDEVPGLKVAVQMGGVDVKEYDAPEAGDDDQDCPTLTKYIECIDDAFFAVRYRVNDQYRLGDHKNPHSLRFKIKVDGRWIRSPIIGSKSNGTCQGRDVVDNMGSYKIQRLQFATIKTVDDAKKERVKNDTKDTKDLGLIEVEVRRGISHGSVSDEPQQLDNREKFEFAEKSLKGKAISHGVTLRSTMSSSKPSFVDFEDLDDLPLAVFRFMYRSRDALKREMIIPRTPTPPPPSFTALSEEELRRLARERFEQLRDTPIKNERARPIKREFGEIQDLTGDGVPKKQRKGKQTRIDGKKVTLIELSDDEED